MSDATPAEDRRRELEQEIEHYQPEPMTLQQQLAEQLTELEELNRSTYLPLPFYQKNKAMIKTLQAILDIEKKRLSGSHDTFTAGKVAGYNSALATVAEVAGGGMRG